MNINITRKLMLGLMLTGFVAPSNGAEDQFLLSFALNKPVTQAEVSTLVKSDPSLIRAIAEDMKSEEYEEKQISEILEEATLILPGQSFTEVVQNAGVASQLKATGRAVNDDTKFIARQMKRSGYSLDDNDSFHATEVAHGAKLFETHAQFGAKAIIESVGANIKGGATDVNAVQDVNIRPLLEVSQLNVPAKPRYLAARGRLTDAGHIVQAVDVLHPTTEEIKASAFLDKDGDADPAQNLFDQVMAIQALGIAKPIAAIRDVYDQLIAGGGHLPAIPNPTRMEVITGIAFDVAGAGNPTPEQFYQAKAMIEQIELEVKTMPGAQNIDFADAAVLDSVNYVRTNEVALGVTNEQEFFSTVLATIYLVKEHGRVANTIVKADIDGLDHLFNTLRIQKPSKYELKAVKELQDDTQNLDIQKPSKEDIAAVIQLQKKLARGGLNIQHPTDVQFEAIKNLQVKYQIAQPTLDQEAQRDRLVIAGAVDLQGTEIVEADRLAKIVNNAHRIINASIEDVRESLRLTLQQGLDALPSIKPNIDEGRRLQGALAGATKEPTGRQILEGIRLATAGGALDRVANAHIDMINDSIRLQGLVGPDRIAAPTKTILDESKRLNEAADGIENPTGRQVRASLDLQDAGVMDVAIAVPSGAQITARLYAHLLANAVTVGAYANTNVEAETNAIAYIMTDPDDRLGFEEVAPDEAAINAAVKILSLNPKYITPNNWAAIMALHTEQEAVVAPAIDPSKAQIVAVGKLDMASDEQNFVAWKIQKEVALHNAAYVPCFLAKCVAKDAAFITFDVMDTFKPDADLFVNPGLAQARMNGTQFKVSVGVGVGEIAAAFAGTLAVNQLVAIDQIDVDAVVPDRLTVAGIDKK